MKFGKTLQQNQVPDWAAGYVNYKSLKKLVAAAAARRKQLGNQPLPEGDPQRAAFFAALEAEVRKVDDFFVFLRTETMQRCHEISALQQAVAGRRQQSSSAAAAAAAAPEAPDDATLVGSPASDAGGGGGEDPAAALEDVDDYAMLDEAIDLKGELDELVNFQHVNLEGFRKILKKFDKRLKEQTLTSYMAEKIAVTPLADSSFLQSIELAVDGIVKTAHANVENRKAHEKEWKTYDF